jgi:FKBP-type peptidyl-prolyl cis-trans isomerases 2
MKQMKLQFIAVTTVVLWISLWPAAITAWSSTDLLYNGRNAGSGSSRSSGKSSRRSFLKRTSTAPGVLTFTGASLFQPQSSFASASEQPSLKFSTSASGIKWADAKVGSGPTLKSGDSVSIDYVLSTTGARYGSFIYKTSDKGAPYRWVLGDGSTIPGLEEAIVGSEGMSPMEPGGIRRVILPQALAYDKLKNGNEDCGKKGTFGPVPPSQEAFEEFQRFKIYIVTLIGNISQML